MAVLTDVCADCCAGCVAEAEIVCLSTQFQMCESAEASAMARVLELEDEKRHFQQETFSLNAQLLASQDQLSEASAQIMDLRERSEVHAAGVEESEREALRLRQKVQQQHDVTEAGLVNALERQQVVTGLTIVLRISNEIRRRRLWQRLHWWKQQAEQCVTQAQLGKLPAATCCHNCLTGSSTCAETSCTRAS